MTFPTLPRGLRPIVAGYSAGPPPGVARTEVEGGAPRTALAYDRGMQVFNVSFQPMVGVQFQAWNLFFHHVIKKGAVTFSMPMDTGMGEQAHDVTMLPGSYHATRMGGGVHSVSFQVETENQAYQMTTAEGEAFVELFDKYGASLPTLLDRLAQFALVDTLVLDF